MKKSRNNCSCSLASALRHEHVALDIDNQQPNDGRHIICVNVHFLAQNVAIVLDHVPELHHALSQQTATATVVDVHIDGKGIAQLFDLFFQRL